MKNELKVDVSARVDISECRAQPAERDIHAVISVVIYHV